MDEASTFVSSNSRDFCATIALYEFAAQPQSSQ